jgi:hypothetical protein
MNFEETGGPNSPVFEPQYHQKEEEVFEDHN